MSRNFHLAQINFARLPRPLSDPKMGEFVGFLDQVNRLAEASPGFVWRMDEHSAMACGDRLFPGQPRGTTLINLSVWKSTGALQSYATLGLDGGILSARQSFFRRFQGRWIALWWVRDGYFPEVADGWARLLHRRWHGDTPHAFSLSQVYPAPRDAREEADHLPRVVLDPLPAADAVQPVAG